MDVRGLTVGPFEENCWIVADPAAGEAVCIDPGDEGARILASIAETGCRLTAIWLTHAHLDHVGAIADVLAVHDVPVLLHAADLPLYRTVDRQAARFGLRMVAPPEPTTAIAEGDVLTCGSLAFTVWHLPGHAPGHVAFVHQDHVFSGDVLFAGSIGRTDLPLADPAAMQQSLERLATLHASTTVWPGHGPTTTIAREVATNPFLAGQARPLGASLSSLSSR